MRGFITRFSRLTPDLERLALLSGAEPPAILNAMLPNWKEDNIKS